MQGTCAAHLTQAVKTSRKANNYGDTQWASLQETKGKEGAGGYPLTDKKVFLRIGLLSPLRLCEADRSRGTRGGGGGAACAGLSGRSKEPYCRMASALRNPASLRSRDRELAALLPFVAVATVVAESLREDVPRVLGRDDGSLGPF